MPPEGVDTSDSEQEKLIMSSSMEPKLTWDDNSQGVEEFLKNWNLPQVVKLHGGNYGNFGTGTNVDVKNPFLLYRSRRRSKVSATSLCWDDAQKAYVQVGPSIAIPIDYAGWFQFLLEDHKVCNYCDSIEKVSQAEPDSFLSQTPVTGYRFAQDAVNGKRLYVKEETCPGEVFSVSHLYVETITTSKIACCFHWFLKNSFYKEKVKEIQYLHCSDSRGNEYLLPFSETGAFNPVGPVGTKNPSYVYQLEDMVRHLELPVIVRLVLGQEPPTQCSFTGILRLDEIYSEETVVACAMNKQKHLLVEFSLDSDIEFIRANNIDNYIHFPDFKSTLNYCEHNLEQYMRNIKVIQNFYPDHIKTKVDDTKAEEAVKERSLPPTPLPLTPELEHHSGMDEKITQSETTEAYDSSEWDDEEDDDENDPCYESIPVDLRQREDIAMVTDGEEVEGKPFISLDEEGYCVPQHTYGNMATLRAEALRQQRARKSSDDQTTESSQSLVKHKRPDSDKDQVAPCKRCAERQLSGTSEELENKEYCNEDTLTRRHYDVPPSRPHLHDYGSADKNGRWTQEWLDCRDNGDSIPDRMDMFLSDSVRELSRIQNTAEVDHPPLSPLGVNVSTESGTKSNFVTPETKEEVDEFLDKLFDCDLMTECDYSLKTPLPTLGGQVMSKRTYGRYHSVPCDSKAWYGSFRRNPLESKTKKGFHPNATIRRHNQISRSHMDIFGDMANLKTSNQASPGSNLQDVSIAFNPIYQQKPESLNDNTFSSISESSVERQSDNVPMFDGDAFEYSNADSGILASPRPWSEYGGGSYRNEPDMIYKAYSDVGLWNPPTDISVMSVFDVVTSLRYIGIQETRVRKFYDEQIDGKQLQELDETLLKEGFPELNALERKKIMDFIRGWRPKK